MKRMEAIEVGKVLKGTVLYALKMCAFSAIAAVPTYFVHKLMTGFFEGHGRIVGFGAPVIISAIVFGIVGVLELVITRDEIISVILKKVKR